jgi:Putative phage tail protein
MDPIIEIKEREVADTPLILFDCVFPDGSEQHWSTHRVSVDAVSYEPRVLSHNVFELRYGSDDGVDGISRANLTLANADAFFSAVTLEGRWKGARLTAGFGFFDVRTGQPTSEQRVLFKGIAGAPEEVTERHLKLGLTNRLGLQRALIPEVRIQKLCPWTFPRTPEERALAVDGGEEGKYSLFYRCGYSADQAGGVGSLNAGQPYLSCDFSRTSCEQRGMFEAGRFGGIEFVPAEVLVRAAGESGSRVSAVQDNKAKYNDFVPVIYGTAWVQPPVVLSRNDGNLTRMEVLLSLGKIHDVTKVLVNDVEIPAGVAGTNMTATGWYNLVNDGARSGGFNLDFTDAVGEPLGDPYGSMAFLSVVVPNRLNDGRTLPRVQVLCDGLELATYGVDGAPLGESFTNNPVWVALDILRRSGWTEDELDLPSFGRAAAVCDELVAATDLFGQAVNIARYSCNLALRRRRSVAEVLRGVRMASGLFLVYGATGKLECGIESAIDDQQPTLPSGSNAGTDLDGGWPAYEFGDGTAGRGGIARRANGDSSLRLSGLATGQSANRYSLEFQDAFNEYQQDSLSLVDVDDVRASGQEVSATHSAMGVPNFHQAARLLRRQLDKSVRGNLFVEFETSVRAVTLRPGDLITVTSLRDGLDRQLFRVLRIAPGLDYRRPTVVAQIHSDGWYSDAVTLGDSGRGRRQGASGVGLPRPLVGDLIGMGGEPEFSITEVLDTAADGSEKVQLTVGFVTPRDPEASRSRVPLLALTPQLASTGGTIGGGATYYYALSGVDADGRESELSFVVRATIPAGTATNAVTLTGLSFSPGTASFHVYRGRNPQQLYRIAEAASLASTFVDTGLAVAAAGPADANYDHARFDWRLELHPPVAVTLAAARLVNATVWNLSVDEYKGKAIRVLSGKGAGQERLIESNTEHDVILVRAWAVVPDITSEVVLVESNWQVGTTTASSPARFLVSARDGSTIHVAGIAVNSDGRENLAELTLMARWQLGSGGANAGDADVPPKPVFGLSVPGRGELQVRGIGFPSLTNTRTISAGTLAVHYSDEVDTTAPVVLDGAVDDSATVISLSAARSPAATVGQILRIGSELLEIIAVNSGGLEYEVRRGSHSSVSAAHSAGSIVVHLERRVVIIPFARAFFGSPSSGSFAYSLALPSARVSAADLFMTNANGNSETEKASYADLLNSGLRTLSGGQFNLQVSGHMAVQTDATPPLVVEQARSVRDVFAVVKEAPTGHSLDMKLWKNGTVYCDLSIAVGATISNVIDGATLPPLEPLSRLRLDVVEVGTTPTSTPGRDLTVTIRL